MASNEVPLAIPNLTASDLVNRFGVWAARDTMKLVRGKTYPRIHVLSRASAPHTELSPAEGVASLRGSLVWTRPRPQFEG
eukprot:3421876-Rhodomonas_salina.2